MSPAAVSRLSRHKLHLRVAVRTRQAARSELEQGGRCYPRPMADQRNRRYRQRAAASVRRGPEHQFFVRRGQRPDSTGRSADVPKGERTLERWLNTTEFVLPAPYTFGNVERLHPTLRGDRVENLDFSVFKELSHPRARSGYNCRPRRLTCSITPSSPIRIRRLAM